MASIVLGAVGAIAGGLIGGPAGAMLGFSAGAAVGGVAQGLMTKNKTQDLNKLSDVRVMGSGYGQIIPQAYGLSRIAGNLIWATDLVQTHQDSTGGKGALSAPDVRTYSYFGNFAIGVCQGPINAIHRIWAEDLLIYDDSITPLPSNYNITIYLGTETQTSDPFIESYVGAGLNPAYRGLAYVVFNMLPLHKWGNRIPNITFEVDAGAATVGSILSNVFGQCGLTPSQYDVSLATTPVTGLILGSRDTAKSFITPVLQSLATDIAEADGKIKAIPRGGGTDIVVAAGDLGTDFWKGGDSNGDTPPSLKARRIHDLELPVSIEVTYFSSTKLYESGSQRAVRYSKAGYTKDAQTFNTTLVMTDDKARQTAEFLLYDTWIGREQTEIVLPPAYIQAIPGSILLVPVAGSTVRYRVVRMDIGIFGPIQFTLTRDDTNVLIQTIAGGSLGTVTSVLVNPKTAVFKAFCINALRDDDADEIGYYVFAAGNVGDDWEGVQVYQSRNVLNPNTAYNPTFQIKDSATYGTVLSVIPAGKSTAVLDNVTTIDINLVTGAIASVDIDTLLSGMNAAAVGSSANGYEVIQFLNVVSLGSGNYRLSGLIRGGRGTDYCWGTHVAGDDFILLEEGAVKRKNVNRQLIGKTINVKALASNQQLGDVSPYPITITGQELRPYTPCDVAGTRGGGGDLTVTWNRRVRENGEWADLSDVALDEPAELYQVQIFTDHTYSTVVRTFSSLTSATVTYTAAQQTTDFGGTQATVYLQVAQWGDYPANNTTSPRQLGYAESAAV